MTLTERDTEILSVLSQLRVATNLQLARIFWPGQQNAEQNARTRLRQLEQTGLINLREVCVHPQIDLDAALATWCPGDPQPNFGALAWQATKRWRRTPVRTVTATATDKGRSMVGSPPGRRTIRTRELGHDIHVSQIFLAHYYPDRRDSWTSEEELKERGWTHAFVPDALVNTDGQPVAIDFLGRYAAAKIAGMHHAYAQAGVAYELW